MISNGSPYWLQLFGHWLRLEGVSQGVQMSPGRAMSSIVTLDGVQYVQKAPKGPRSWSVSLSLQTPDVVAALQIAADTDTDVWLMDETASMANMLAPSDCYGSGAMVACGSLWLPALNLAAAKTITLPVRVGIPYWLRFWGDTGSDEASVSAGTATLLTLTASGGAASGTFTPTADGTVTVTLPAGATIAGVMVTERIAPSEFAQGNSMPCKVSVSDATQTAQMAWSNQASLSDWSVTLSEVG